MKLGIPGANFGHPYKGMGPLSLNRLAESPYPNHKPKLSMKFSSSIHTMGMGGGGGGHKML